MRPISWDAGSIEARAEIDTEPFQLALVRMDQEGRKFADKSYKATVGADTADADAKIDDTEAKLKRVGTSRTTARVGADTTDAELKITPLTERLDDIRTRISTARVDADTESAKLKLDQIDLAARRIGNITARPKVTVDGIERADLQLDALELRLRALSLTHATPSVSGSSGGRGGFSSVLHDLGGVAPKAKTLAIVAAVPTIAPLAGLVAGLGAGLLTPFTAATIGIGSFGLAAKSTISKVSADVKTLTADQAAYNAATSDKTRTAAQAKELKFWNSLPKQEQAAVNNLHALSKEWSSFQSSLKPEIYPLISGGVGLADKALHLLLPTATATGKALDGIETSVTKAFGSPFWKQFFGQFLPGQAVKATDSFATAIGNTVTGIGHLVEAFAPLGGGFESGLDRLTKRFEDWSEGGGPSKFVNWVHKNAPVLEHDLGEVATGVEHIAKALIPVGTDVLHAVGDVAGVLGKFAKDDPTLFKHLGEGLLITATGLKAIEGTEKAIAILTVLSRLSPGGGGFGSKGWSKKVPVPVIAPTDTAAAESAAEAAAAAAAAAGGATVGIAAAVAAVPAIVSIAATYGISKLPRSAPNANQAGRFTGFDASGQAGAVGKQQVSDLNDYTKAVKISNAATDTYAGAIKVYRGNLLAAGDSLDTVNAKTAVYEHTLKGIPAAVVTKINASTATAEERLKRILALRNAIAGDVGVTVTAQQGRNIERDPSNTGNKSTTSGSGGKKKKLTSDDHLRLVGPLSHTSHPPGWLTGMGSTSPNAPTSSSSSGSHSTASKGPTAHAISTGLASIANYAGLTFLNDLEGSTVKEIRDGINTMIDRLNTAVRDKYLSSDKTLVHALNASRSVLEGASRAEKHVSDELTGDHIPGVGAIQRLSTLRSDASSVRSTARSNFRGLGDIGQIATGTSVSGIISVLGKQDAVATAFARNLGILRKKGLDDAAYMQLLNEGPAAAGQEVAELATATKGQIHRINEEEGKLGALGKSTGTASANYLYRAKITAAAADVRTLRDDEHHLLLLQKQAAKDLQSVVKDGIKDPGTHKGLAVLHQDLRSLSRAMNQLAGVPKQARNKQRTKVSR